MMESGAAGLVYNSDNNTTSSDDMLAYVIPLVCFILWETRRRRYYVEDGVVGEGGGGGVVAIYLTTYYMRLDSMYAGILTASSGFRQSLNRTRGKQLGESFPDMGHGGRKVEVEDRAV